MNENKFLEKAEYLHDEAVNNGFWNNSVESLVYKRILLIHSEISEAAEALRVGRWANYKYYKELSKEGYYMSAYETYIKDTVEVEIADTVIRAFDLYGALGYNNEDYIKEVDSLGRFSKKDSFEYCLDVIHMYVSDLFVMYRSFASNYTEKKLIQVIYLLYDFSKLVNFDLDNYIDIKVEINRKRGYKHGKYF